MIITSLQGLSSVHISEDEIDNISDVFTSKKNIRRRKDEQRNLSSRIDDVLKKLSLLNKTKVLAHNWCIEFTEYARLLAAYLLAFQEERESESKYREVFLSLAYVLQMVAPSSKGELRDLRSMAKSEDSRILSLGFSWQDLKSPFVAEQFVRRFLNSDIQMVREIIKEVVKEKTIIQTKIIEKEIPVYQENPQSSVTKNFGKEDQYTEFKSTFFCNSYNGFPQPYNVCRAICAFLNSEGGTIFVGVGDNGIALPEYTNGFAAGIQADIEYLYSAHRLLNDKKDVDAYCRTIKKEITKRFRDGNNIDRFINDIQVNPVQNQENVIEIVIPQAPNVIYLENNAYQRSGAECKSMTESQIEQRTRELQNGEKSFIATLKRAIKMKRQVILHSYRSTSSGCEGDRYVEPFDFIRDRKFVVCYDLNTQSNLQFKLSRISDIEVLKSMWTHESDHKKIEYDTFGWSRTDQEYHICLEMDSIAVTHLCESYSSTKQIVKKVKKSGTDSWVMDTKVYSLKPVIGFFLTYAEHIIINDTEDFPHLKDEIRSYIERVIIPKL